MRRDSRKPRAFRPLEASLEPRNPVSTLVPGLSATPPTLVIAQDPSAFPSKAAASRPHADSSVAAPSTFTDAPAVVAQSQPTGVSPSFSSVITAAQPGSARSLGATSVNIASLSAPSATPVPIVAASDGSSSGVSGSGGNPAYGAFSTSAAPAVASAAPVTGTTAPVVLDAIAAPTGQGAIRSLSMAPTNTQVNGAGASPMSGGGPPTDKPPTITGGSGGAVVPVLDGNKNPIPGKYQIVNPVPIGSIISISAGSPDGDYTIYTNDWGGGDNYSGYTSGSADAAPNQAQSVQPNTSMYSATYDFIVDQSNHSYSIMDQVTYDNGAHGISTVTFTSDAPTGTLQDFQNAQNNFEQQKGGMSPGGGNYIVYLSGIQIAATTKTDQWTAGTFMFLQIVNNVYESSTVNGNTTYYKNNIDLSNQIPRGQNFNGPLHDGYDQSKLGYNYFFSNDPNINQPGGPKINTFYTLLANQSVPNLPNVGSPVLPDAPASDSGSPNPTMATVTESFSTYLMYMPNSAGAWIAIAELDWNWSETATIQGGQLVAPVSNMPKPSTPTGAAAFPTWVNISSNFLNEGVGLLNSPRNGNPGP